MSCSTPDSSRGKAAQFWDREVVSPIHSDWMANPRIREYMCRLISGTDEILWPLDYLQRWLHGRRFRRALSIGCGAGALERDLIRRNLADRIDACDGSTNSLRVARAQAAKEGMQSRAADFNRPFFPERTWDAVFIHQALHHVEKLEKLLHNIRRALTRDGVLYLDEYIGPSRHQWNEALVSDQKAVYDSMPAQARLFPVMPLPMAPEDPTEAFRSAEILDQVAAGFGIRTIRPYGGNLLSVVCPCLDLGALGVEGVDDLIERDRAFLQRQQSFYALIIATPKRGLAGIMAGLRYFALPKIKRVGREMKRLIPNLS